MVPYQIVMHEYIADHNNPHFQLKTVFLAVIMILYLTV
jgi:hypothetical protein